MDAGGSTDDPIWSVPKVRYCAFYEPSAAFDAVKVL